MKILVQAGAHSTSVEERRLDDRAISLPPLRLNCGFPVLSCLDLKPPELVDVLGKCQKTSIHNGIAGDS